MGNKRIKHLTKVNMTYFEHLKFTIYLSSTFLKLSCLSIIHGIYPEIFTDNVSNRIKKLNDEFISRSEKYESEGSSSIIN